MNLDNSIFGSDTGLDELYDIEDTDSTMMTGAEPNAEIEHSNINDKLSPKQDKALKFMKDRIREKINLIKNRMSDVKYRLYMIKIDSAKTIDEVRAISEIQSQLDFIKYLKKIDTQIKSLDTNVDDIEQTTLKDSAITRFSIIEPSSNKKNIKSTKSSIDTIDLLNDLNDEELFSTMLDIVNKQEENGEALGYYNDDEDEIDEDTDSEFADFDEEDDPLGEFDEDDDSDDFGDFDEDDYDDSMFEDDDNDEEDDSDEFGDFEDDVDTSDMFIDDDEEDEDTDSEFGDFDEDDNYDDSMFEDDDGESDEDDSEFGDFDDTDFDDAYNDEDEEGTDSEFGDFDEDDNYDDSMFEDDEDSDDSMFSDFDDTDSEYDEQYADYGDDEDDEFSTDTDEFDPDNMFEDDDEEDDFEELDEEDSEFEDFDDDESDSDSMFEDFDDDEDDTDDNSSNASGSDFKDLDDFDSTFVNRNVQRQQNNQSSDTRKPHNVNRGNVFKNGSERGEKTQKTFDSITRLFGGASKAAKKAGHKISKTSRSSFFDLDSEDNKD